LIRAHYGPTSTSFWTLTCERGAGGDGGAGAGPRILDTSTLILLPRLADAETLPTEPLIITTVTLAELSVGPLVTDDQSEREARQAHLQQAEADFDPLPFDASAARAFGRVAASLRRSGRKSSARAYDAMIAAIAVANHLPVYTCNPADFREIDGLEIVAVAVPEPDGDAA
jgi:tRNA(fMet)-specific endonuclease VapC